MLSGATPVKVELWEGDHNEYPEGEVVTASGTKIIEYNGELIVGV